MSDDRQFGEGQDNYLQGIRSAAEAAKQAGSAAGSVGTAAGEATANRGRSYSASRYGDWQKRRQRSPSERLLAGRGVPYSQRRGLSATRSLRSWCFSACSCCSLSLP